MRVLLCFACCFHVSAGIFTNVRYHWIHVPAEPTSFHFRSFTPGLNHQKGRRSSLWMLWLKGLVRCSCARVEKLRGEIWVTSWAAVRWLPPCVPTFKSTCFLSKINDLPVFGYRISLRRVYTAVQFDYRIHCQRPDRKMHVRVEAYRSCTHQLSNCYDSSQHHLHLPPSNCHWDHSPLSEWH